MAKVNRAEEEQQENVVQDEEIVLVEVETLEMEEESESEEDTQIESVDAAFSEDAGFEESASSDPDAIDAVEPTESSEPEDMPITLEDVRLVEAILFASAHALTVGQIAERFPEARRSLIPDVLQILQEQYQNKGVNLVQRESRWALRTSTDLGAALRLEKEQPKKFTRAAMETMAIIAYHQPVTRAEIENIRGVATSPGALDALMEAGWIKTGKRREVPGRPVTWQTTQAFLDHFGLEKLEDLPGMDDLKAAGLLDKRPAIEAMPTTSDLFDSERPDEAAQVVTDEDLLGKPEAQENEAGEESDSEDQEHQTLETDDTAEEIDGEIIMTELVAEEYVADAMTEDVILEDAQMAAIAGGDEDEDDFDDEDDESDDEEDDDLDDESEEDSDEDDSDDDDSDEDDESDTDDDSDDDDFDDEEDESDDEDDLDDEEEEGKH